MTDLRPFRALRPGGEAAARVVAPPYDVVDVTEARTLAEGNPDSFLHVNRPDIDLPDGTPSDSEPVHRAGRAALATLVERGLLVLDGMPSYAVYRLVRGGRTQTGVVAAAGVADYVSGLIRTHEQTRPDKEDERVHHIEGIGAHDEPVFLLVAPGEPSWTPVAAILTRVTRSRPDLDVSTSDLTTGEPVDHALWHVADPSLVSDLAAALAAIPVLYVADGHHRSAAAARVAAADPAGPGRDAFPVVLFPGEELTVLPYNRVVADLAGRSEDELLAELDGPYAVRALGEDQDPAPAGAGELGLRLPGRWLRLTTRPAASADRATPEDQVGIGEVTGTDTADPVCRLDVSVLHNTVLGPVLGITDVRTDPRIGFVGGIRGPGELVRLVDSGRWAAAFLLHPTSVDELVAVAASGRDMPPKSTWFEPKLASGLFVHRLADQT